MLTDKNLTILKNLGAKIKSIREEKGILQHDLAAMCNFEKSSMARIEAGRTNPTYLTLSKIAISLNLTISELLK